MESNGSGASITNLFVGSATTGIGMSFPFINRKLVESLIAEKDARISYLENEITTLKADNKELVNALASTQRAVAPFRSDQPQQPPPKPISRPNINQLQKRMERLRRGQYEMGLLPGRPDWAKTS